MKTFDFDDYDVKFNDDVGCAWSSLNLILTIYISMMILLLMNVVDLFYLP